MDLKAAYSRMLKEDFPDTMTITLGGEKLIYHKCQWEIAGEKKGLRYGENPDQPAALYRLVEGGLSLGGLHWRSPRDLTNDRRPYISSEEAPEKTGEAEKRAPKRRL